MKPNLGAKPVLALLGPHDQALDELVHAEANHLRGEVHNGDTDKIKRGVDNLTRLGLQEHHDTGAGSVIRGDAD